MPLIWNEVETVLFNQAKHKFKMKKNHFSYSRMVAAIIVIITVSCSAALLSPSFAKTKKDKPAKAAIQPTSHTEQAPVNAPSPEATQLVQRLIADRMVDESKGFVVEKKQNLLFINGKEQAAAIANKYLQNVQQTDIRVQVFSFGERLQMHPDAGIMELIMPVMFSSGCVHYDPPKKPGC